MNKLTANTFNLKLFGYNVFCFYYRNNLGWFRLFDVGLHWKDLRKHPLIFSERIGKMKRIQIGNYSFGYLPKK